MVKNIIIYLLSIFVFVGCGNKIVFISVDQEAARENKLLLDDNVLETQDSFETDSKPVIEVPL